MFILTNDVIQSKDAVVVRAESKPSLSFFRIEYHSLALCLNIVLTFFGWIPGMIHAWFVAVK